MWKAVRGGFGDDCIFYQIFLGISLVLNVGVTVDDFIQRSKQGGLEDQVRRLE